MALETTAAVRSGPVVTATAPSPPAGHGDVPPVAGRRVARTVADLAGDEGPLTAGHVAAALTLRSTPAFLSGRAA